MFDPDSHHHRSIRLKNYDYSTGGAYFVTIVTQDRECLFGDIRDGIMCLNDAGNRMKQIWCEMPNRFSSVSLDGFVMMPNHFHAILVINGLDELQKPVTLGNIIGAFKSISTNEYIVGVEQSGWTAFPGRLWQRNYHEQIIRDDESLERIREYIFNNPLQWHLDSENPDVTTE